MAETTEAQTGTRVGDWGGRPPDLLRLSCDWSFGTCDDHTVATHRCLVCRQDLCTACLEFHSRGRDSRRHDCLSIDVLTVMWSQVTNLMPSSRPVLQPTRRENETAEWQQQNYAAAKAKEVAPPLAPTVFCTKTGKPVVGLKPKPGGTQPKPVLGLGTPSADLHTFTAVRAPAAAAASAPAPTGGETCCPTCGVAAAPGTKFCLKCGRRNRILAGPRTQEDYAPLPMSTTGPVGRSVGRPAGVRLLRRLLLFTGRAVCSRCRC
jgi:hypothetical protein